MRDFKVAFFGVKSWERMIIEREIVNLDSVGVGIFEKEVQDNPELAEKYEILSVSIHSTMDRATLGKLSGLRMISTRSTGMDHIDLVECKKRKMVVANVPEYGARSVAEYAMALMMAVAPVLVARSMGRPSSRLRMREMFKCWSMATVSPNQAMLLRLTITVGDVAGLAKL